eukprot:gene46149-31124_t
MLRIRGAPKRARDAAGDAVPPSPKRPKPAGAAGCDRT